ncbi:MAG: hypothetical protein GC181_14035 [Bacteroidetes bacterium]|nr:hypothetical protein [Bacteroidota bacterium]
MIRLVLKLISTNAIWKTFVAILIILTCPRNTFSQKSYYNHTYQRPLNSVPSNYSIDISDSILGASGKSFLHFYLKDSKGRHIQYAEVHVWSLSADSLLYSDSTGTAKMILSKGYYSITIESIQYEDIKIDSLLVTENSSTAVHASLGNSNLLAIAIIHSKRALTEAEIASIIYDLSTEQENELILNKTCFITWEA